VRSTFLYIILGVSVAALVALMMANSNRMRMPDQRITLKKKDKIPYGDYIAFRSLPYLFPGATVVVNKNAPSAWEALSFEKGNQALLIIAPSFQANDDEMKALIAFAQKGNDVFISVRLLSATAQNMMHLRSSMSFGGFEESDSLMIKLDKPPFATTADYIYPGKKYDTYLYRYDSTLTTVLGRNLDGDPDFIRLRTGNGNIYLHLAPLAFSNYFLLHKQNMEYYEKVLSVIPANTEKIVWDEYFYYKFREDSSQQKKGWLDVLLKYDSFRAAFWTLISLLFVYVLLEMRRKQRIIQVIEKPKNDSLEFVKTIGRLYYDRRDHKNLCRKMVSYFLEHVRNRYKLSTGTLDETFVKNLHFKSGYNEKDLQEMVSFINFIETAPAISDGQLSGFYKNMEEFYKRT